jgi:hypothetical protein
VCFLGIGQYVLLTFFPTRTTPELLFGLHHHNEGPNFHPV